MVRDTEDEIRDAKNPLSLHEDDTALLKTPYLGETVVEVGSASEKLNADCDIHSSDGDNGVETAQDIFNYNHVPPKKRHYLGASDICRSFEWLNEHACIVCDIADDCVVPCSGNDCPLAVHYKCAELGCEDPAILYCPYCWFKFQAARSMALRTMVVAAAKALVQYGGNKPKSGDMVIATGNIQLENGSDVSLPMQLHENLNQLREVVEQLKAHNFQLEESNDQFVDMENACGEPSGVVSDQPKRVLWTAKEEDMLRLGVETFSGRIKKNMPWKKILEMGKGVFQKSRTSTDLKDKWRKMILM